MKKKICLICEGTYPYVRGGVAQWAHELIAASRAYDFSVVAVTAGPRTPRDWRYVLPGHVKEIYTINLYEPLRNISGLLQRLQLRKHGQAFRQDLAHALSEASSGNFRGLRDVVRHMDNFHHGLGDIRRQPLLWPILTEVYRQTDSQGSFAPFFWVWDNLVSAALRLFQDRLPPADLYHSASTGLGGFLGTVAKIRTGKPFLLSEHGLYLQERQMELTFDENLTVSQRNAVEAFFAGLSRWAYFEADRITSLSGFIRDHQIANGAAPEKTQIIPNGIDVSRFTDIAREPHRGFHVGLVGRVAPVKDIDMLIMAAKELRPLIPNLRVSIIGPVEDQQYFEECQRRIQQMDLTEIVDFAGLKNQEDCYKDLDVLVMCSLKEVQPLTLMEAMAVGVPVVATRTGAIPEMMANAAIIIPPRDTQSLVRAIMKIRTDHEFAHRLVEVGKRRVQNFDRSKMVDQFHNLYETLQPQKEAAWQASV